MPKYAIHKLGFHFNDEAEIAVESGDTFRGSLVHVYNSLEEAQKAKKASNFSTLKSIPEKDLIGYFFYRKNQDEILDEVDTFYREVLGFAKTERHSIPILEEITQEQASTLLNLLDLSFHEIIEYDDTENLDKKSFGVPEDWDFLWEHE